MNPSQQNDSATQQTVTGLPDMNEINSSLCFTSAEVEELRRLAHRVAEIATSPIQKIKADLWTAHNDLKTTQPLVFIDPENGWNECIPADTLLCADPLARVWEMHLKKQIYWFEVLKDDHIIDDFFDVPSVFTDSGWGLNVALEGGHDGGAYKVKQAIEDYEEDFDKVHYPQITVDWAESERLLSLAQEVFDGILQVRRKHLWWWSLGMTWDFINLRGLEDFMVDLLLEPEWVHRLMNLLCEGQLNKIDFLQKNNLLISNVGNTYIGSGGFGYTSELNNHPTQLSTMDMWGFVESQETVGINPDAYGEFIFPYHLRMAELFGLNCYGCCEPTDVRWKYVKQLPRLRRVSYSPWAKWELAPEHLGSNYVTSLKPIPTHLAMPSMNEDDVRKDIQRALRATKGCVTEILMKDTHTLGNCPRNASRWVEIVREEIEKG